MCLPLLMAVDRIYTNQQVRQFKLDACTVFALIQIRQNRVFLAVQRRYGAGMDRAAGKKGQSWHDRRRTKRPTWA